MKKLIQAILIGIVLGTTFCTQLFAQPGSLRPDKEMDVEFLQHIDWLDAKTEGFDFFGKLPSGTTKLLINGKEAMLVGDRFAAPKVNWDANSNSVEFAYTDSAGNTKTKTIQLKTQDLSKNPDAIGMPNGLVVPKMGIDPKIVERLRQFGIEKSFDANANSSNDNVPKVHVVLQFNEPTSTKSAKKAFPGMKYLDRLSKSSWIASVSEADLGRLQSSDVLRSAFVPTDQNKLRMNLMNVATADVDNPVRARVRFHQDVTKEQALAVLRDSGAIFDPTKQGMLNDWEVAIAPDKLLELTTRDGVRYVDGTEPERARENDRSRANARVEGLDTTPFNLTGSGVNGGIWDGGLVDADHPDFNGRLTALEIADEDDHATHVAGTMGGDGTADTANSGRLRGMAPGMMILTRDYHGLTAEEHENAIDNHDLDLSQNSWGYSSVVVNRHGLYGDTTEKYDKVVYGEYNRRIPVVFSAGNEQRHGPFRTVNAPGGTGKNIISVGAINNDDSSMTDFSSWGPTDDGRLKPDLVAPGGTTDDSTGIVSAIPRGVDTQSSFDLRNNAPGPRMGPGDNIDNFFFPYSDSLAGPNELENENQVPASADVWEGTSMAAPVVSGVIALMLEEYRMTFAATANASIRPLPSTFHAILTNSAEDLTDDPRTATAVNFVGPDFIYGYGRLHATNAVLMIRNSDFIEDDIDEETDVDDHTVVLPTGLSEWKVNLAWDDPAASGDPRGAPTSQSKLINDLDLVLIAPDGTKHYPWVLDPANPDVPATRSIRAQDVPENSQDFDHFNNCVQVTVDSPAAGQWTIRVKSSSLPDDNQPQLYSLAFPRTFRDLMIRDIALDRGNPGSPAPWWNSPDIQIHETDTSKSIKLRISNRGYLPVSDAKIRVFCTPASATVPQFELNGDDINQPWKLVASQQIGNIEGGSLKELEIKWPEQLSSMNPNQMCLAVLIDSPDDPVDLAGQTNLGLLAQKNNNVAYRNVLPMVSNMSTEIDESSVFDATQLPCCALLTPVNSRTSAVTSASSEIDVAEYRIRARSVARPNSMSGRIQVKFERLEEFSNGKSPSILQILDRKNGRVIGGLSVIHEKKRQ